MADLAFRRWNDHFAIDDRGTGIAMPGVGRDFLEAVGPVVAAASKHLNRRVRDVDLNAVAVEFDFVYPAVTGRYVAYRRCKGRRNETGKWSLEPVAGGLARRWAMIRLSASATEVGYRGICLRIGRRSPEGKTGRRAAADRSADAIHGRRPPKRLATILQRC
jgi:hypothetical protein